MALAAKVLWIVDMSTDTSETAFAKNAMAIGATAVCIRTSSQRLNGAIGRFHAFGMKVYAWRWPQVIPAKLQAEAANVVNLISAGLDGYIVDPESDGPGNNDWNQPGLGLRAKEFCDTIRNAANGNPFVFGTTSGCTYPDPSGKPNIPWAEFFAASDVLLPQTYWRWTNDAGEVENINGGNPQKAIDRGLNAWKPRSHGKPIVPMTGEADVVKPQEIADYGARLAALNVTEGHFYTDNGKIPETNLAAIRAL